MPADVTSYLLWAAADEAYKKLNQYWQKTDNHTGQVVATILDPRMKLTVFENLGWDREWIEIARAKFMKVYSRYYAKYEDSRLTGRGIDSNCDGYGTPGTIPQPGGHSSDRFSDFNSLVFGPIEEAEPLQGAETIATNYLDEERVERGATPINWWKLHAHRFRSLAVMARDYLSVPATRSEFFLTEAFPVS